MTQPNRRPKSRSKQRPTHDSSQRPPQRRGGGRPPGRPGRDTGSGPPKEHPQYGSRIPPEELEAMRELQREHARKDRLRYDDGRRGRFDRPDRGGSFRREGGPSGYGRDSRPPRFERPGRDGGPRRDSGSRPGRGPRQEYGARRDEGFRPDRDRDRGPRTERPPRREHPARPGRPHRAGSPNAGLGPPRPVPLPEQPPLERIRNLLFSYQMTAALLAAYSLGVFRELHARPQTHADLARSCACAPRAMEALLDALVAIGALQRHDTTYVIARDLTPYLVPGVDGDATGLIEMAGELYGAYADLAPAVREGKPLYPLTGDAILQGDPGRVRRYIRAVHTGSREAAVRVAQMAPLLPGSSLLDVGGGSGIYAATFARQTPDLVAHLFDLPPTLDVARELLAAEGLEGTLTFHAGDFRHDPFPGPVDTVLLSNVLQTESEEHAVGVLKRAREALGPGGSLLVHGVMPDDGAPPQGPVALFSLMMFSLFGQGRAWSTQKVSGWLAQEGFGVRWARPLGEPFHSKLILATRLE